MLPFCWLTVILQPAVIPSFTDFQNLTHLLYCVLPFLSDENMPFWSLYLFRSFAKKTNASFNISLAVRSSAFSRSNSRIRISCSVWFIPFVGRPVIWPVSCFASLPVCSMGNLTVVPPSSRRSRLTVSELLLWIRDCILHSFFPLSCSFFDYIRV